MAEQALMVAIELIDSADPDDELIGINGRFQNICNPKKNDFPLKSYFLCNYNPDLISRVLAGDDDEEDEEMSILLAAAASNTPRLPDPYLLNVRDACRCPHLAGICTC
jgi:hypothetical protein